MVLGVMCVIIEFGLCVGVDISVVGYDDIEDSLCYILLLIIIK